MQTRILTRLTTFIVFILTCCVTVEVVANERGLAPELSPDAWKLLLDAEAVAQGFTPTQVQSFTLEPRQKMVKRPLVKRPNSRVKVKFNDELKIRLDVHSKPYSRTGSSESVGALIESLGVELVPTLERSQADIDALIHKAELVSRKQMPDVGGIYWVTGEESAVDVAAELLWTMEEVEWVMYKPVYSKMSRAPEQPDFTFPESSNPSPTITPAAPKETTFGACHFAKGDCVEDTGQTDCINQGGLFFGPNSICFDVRDEETNEDRALLPAIGECCTLTNCVKATEAQCNALNGVLISVIVPPAVACATNTVCPVGIGPTFASYNTCGVLGTPVTLLTGDCYIDQTVLVQTSRVSPPPAPPNPPPNGPPFPAGCADTTGLTPAGALGGPAGTDFVVSTGLDLTQVTNVFTASTCCATITQDVPDCGTAGWNAICASYANAYATDGSGICLRSTNNPVVPPNPCFNPLGPMIQPTFVQPTLNMTTIGTADTGIRITNPTGNGGAVAVAQFQIVETPLAGPPNGCADGDCTLNLVDDGVTVSATPLAGGTINALIGTINGVAGYTATLEGVPAAGATVLDTALNPTALVVIFNNAFGVPSIPQSISTTPINGTTGCFGTGGAPTFDRTATPGITPDYAGLGLLTWMSPQFTPWAGNLTNPPQPTALPCLPITGNPNTLYSQTTLTPDEFFHLTQLLPWPMNGAVLQGNGTQTPTLRTPVSNVKAAGIGWWGGDGGVDLFPDAPAPGGFGGAEVYKGAYGYGQFWADDGVGTAGPNGALINGAFGNGVQVAVLDWSAHLQQRAIVDEFGTTVNLGGIHEEFVQGAGGMTPGALRVLLEGTATGHNALTLNFDENLPFNYSADHGTAVLGIIGANWSTTSPLPGTAAYPPTLTQRLTGVAGVTPNVGVLGMAPDATLLFFPLSTNTSPDREEQAWFNAIETLNAGDIICAAYEPVASTAALPNVNFWEDTASYLQLANGLGICSVIKAGDQGVDLNALELPNGDQNVIVATAVTPGSSSNPITFNGNTIGVPGPPTNPLTPNVAKRYCDGVQFASNFNVGSPQTYSSVTASGWGIGVMTTGKGPNRDNYLGYNTISYAGATPYASPASDPHIVHAQAYTNTFGYTDSAAAQVAGATAILQGFTKQIFGIPMGPQICRQLIAGGKYEGRARDGTPILNPADNITVETGVDSSCETTPNTLDWDWCPVGGGNLVGNLNDPRNAMVNAILNPIFDTPNIDTTLLIRGTLLFGNRFSLSAIDGNLLGAIPVRTRAHVPYNIPSSVPGGPVRYLGNGLVTDLYLSGELQDALPMNNTATIDVTLFPTQQSNMFMRLEMLDARTGRWRQAAATVALPAGSTDASFTVERASAFINPSNNSYHMRLITIDINSPNDEGPTAIYPVLYDLVTITSGLIQN